MLCFCFVFAEFYVLRCFGIACFKVCDVKQRGQALAFVCS
jgi:hypothetical protein